MAYTIAGIVNLALGRIGVKKIADPQAFPFTEDSNQAIKANAVWEYVRDEVVGIRDWKFAKKRTAIGRVAETPASDFDYAYLLPDDFLRLVQTEPNIYPDYPYSIETMDVIEGLGNILDFNPVTAYTAALKSKIGRYCELDCGSSKSLFVAAAYKEDDVTLLSVECVSAADDVLAVTSDENAITISLAKTTSSKNTAALIQTALRALATVNEIDVSAWTVTANAAYVAAPPTSGIDVDAVPMGNGDKAYTCILAGTGKFPAVETSYWTEIEPSAALCLLTDYDNVAGGQELVIIYIRRVTDVILFFPSFISALAFRLAAELSIGLTEGTGKFGGMMGLYNNALISALEVNQSLEYMKTPDPWSEAGR